MNTKTKENKPKSPLQALTLNISKPFYEKLIEEKGTEQQISTEDCQPWLYHDRDDAWMNEKKCQDLIRSIRQHGQKIPALLRQHGESFEIIAGKRRWFACKTLNIPLQAKVLALSDREAAILMHLENKDRQDISDFERALSYKQQLDAKLFASQDDLSKALSISKSQLSKMLKAASIFETLSLDSLKLDITQMPIEKAYHFIRACEQTPNLLKQARKYIETLIKQKVVISAPKLMQGLIELQDSNDDANPELINDKGSCLIATDFKKNHLNIKVHRRAKSASINEIQTFIKDVIQEYLG